MEAKPPVRFRKLRIAWSAGCAIACVLLVVLWVRSYWVAEEVYCRLVPSKAFGVWSGAGRFVLTVHRHPTPYSKRFALMRPYNDEDAPRRIASAEQKRFQAIWGFGAIRKQYAYTIQAMAPQWFILLLTAAIAGLSWLPWQFSLRTLLIAVTLVAVILGIIAVSN